MDPDRTTTETGLSAGAPTRRSGALFVAHHPDRSFVGRWIGVERGVLLGRKAPAWPEGLAVRHLSRRHAEIYPRGSGYWLADLGSHNGTSLNGVAVREGELRPGDVVGLGGIHFVFAEVPGSFRSSSDPELIGVGPAMARILEDVLRVADRDTTVLLQGEPGVGKELVARRLHARSRRRGPFVAVNCAGIAEGVLQSELFGHARGAFSGAGQPRTGLVRQAAGGTLFLDEIGDAAPALQRALLRVLQEGEVRPVGSDRTESVDVRVVAATNADLPALVEAGDFRADLLGRLDRWVVSIPPLRERKEDVGTLALAFAERHAGRQVALSQELAVALLGYDWPGNIRELDAAVERAVVSSDGEDPIPLPEGLRERLRPTPPKKKDPAGSGGLIQRVSGKPVRPERSLLVELLHQRKGHVAALARELGVGRSTMYRWMEELSIDPAEHRGD